MILRYLPHSLFCGNQFEPLTVELVMASSAGHIRDHGQRRE